MPRKKIPGHSREQHNGVLKVASGYLRFPYCMLNSQDFLDLSPLAVKAYLVILRQWKTNHPDEPVEISIEKLCNIITTKRKGKKRKTGRGQMMRAIKQLWKMGFIHKVTQYKQCNKYYIEQKRFTGEWV